MSLPSVELSPEEIRFIETIPPWTVIGVAKAVEFPAKENDTCEM